MPMLKTSAGAVAYADSDFEAAVRLVGTNPVVMLLHSSAGSALQWRKLARLLAPRYRVLAPDPIGYGATPLPAKTPTMEDEVALITTLADTFTGKFHLVGHSYGGAVALEVARRSGSRIASLALFEPVAVHLLRRRGAAVAWAEIEAVATRHIALVEAGDNTACAEAFIGYWIGPGAFAAMPAETQAYVVGTMPKIAAEWRMVFDSHAGAEAYGAFRFPVLLMSGDESTLAARNVAAILKNTMPAAVWRAFPAMGHMGPVTHADVVNTAVADFIDGAAVLNANALAPANDAVAPTRPRLAAGQRRR